MSDTLQFVVEVLKIHLRWKLNPVRLNDKLKHIGHSLTHSSCVESTASQRQTKVYRTFVELFLLCRIQCTSRETEVYRTFVEHSCLIESTARQYVEFSSHLHWCLRLNEVCHSELVGNLSLLAPNLAFGE